VVQNQTLFLAEKILVVLGESNQPIESQLAATEIVVRLLKGEPYGSLAWVNRSPVESTEASNQSHDRHSTLA
jgi:hypothetical protein